MTPIAIGRASGDPDHRRPHVRNRRARNHRRQVGARSIRPSERRRHRELLQRRLESGRPLREPRRRARIGGADRREDADVRGAAHRVQRGNGDARFAGLVRRVQAGVEARSDAEGRRAARDRLLRQASRSRSPRCSKSSRPRSARSWRSARCSARSTRCTRPSARARVEIATLRAIGFGAIPVVVSVLVEALALALIGAAGGAAIAWLLFNGNAFSTGGALGQVAVRLHVGAPLIAAGMVWAATIGLLGGLFPAIRAARMSVVGCVARGLIDHAPAS